MLHKVAQCSVESHCSADNRSCGSGKLVPARQCGWHGDGAYIIFVINITTSASCRWRGGGVTTQQFCSQIDPNYMLVLLVHLIHQHSQPHRHWPMFWGYNDPLCNWPTRDCYNHVTHNQIDLPHMLLQLLAQPRLIHQHIRLNHPWPNSFLLDNFSKSRVLLCLSVEHLDMVPMIDLEEERAEGAYTRLQFDLSLDSADSYVVEELA